MLIAAALRYAGCACWKWAMIPRVRWASRRTFASVNDAGCSGAYRCGKALAGPISFIALVAPHIARRIAAPLAGG